MNSTIGFIGGGNMAASLIGGLLRQGQVSAQQISVFEPSAEKAQQLASQFGINIAPSNTELVQESDIVVIAVKPQVLQAVLEPISNSFRETLPLVVSVVAGITAESIESWLDAPLAIVRIMPNTPALVGMGASGLFANSRVSDEQRDASNTLANAVGVSAWVNSETDIDSVTALSGSGPAYFMLFIQGLIEAAEKAGLTHETAKMLALQTASGAAELIRSSDHSVQTLIDNVTSPNGTTEKALQSFDTAGLKNTISDAFEAARERSKQLAEELA